MSIEQIYDDVKQLTPNEWGVFLSWVINIERPRREADVANAALIESLQNDGKLTPPPATTADEAKAAKSIDAIAEWVNPGTDHAAMYRRDGKCVRHNGRLWESQYNGLNSWEPGVVDSSLWLDVTAQYFPDVDKGADGQAQDGTKAHPWVYADGDKRVYSKGDYVVGSDGVTYLVGVANPLASAWAPTGPIPNVYTAA